MPVPGKVRGKHCLVPPAVSVDGVPSFRTNGHRQRLNSRLSVRSTFHTGTRQHPRVKTCCFRVSRKDKGCMATTRPNGDVLPEKLLTRDQQLRGQTASNPESERADHSGRD
jgi:hypothetical protein